VEAQDGKDPRRAETRPTRQPHDGEGKQRERLGRNHLKILHLKTPPPKSPHNNAKSPKAPKLNRISKHNNLNHTQTQTNVINPQQIKSMDSSHSTNPKPKHNKPSTNLRNQTDTQLTANNEAHFQPRGGSETHRLGGNLRRPLWVSSPQPFVGLCSPSPSPPFVGFFSAALCGSLLAFAVAALCGFLLCRRGSLLCPSWSSPS
jgi:hypothetical protein